MLTDLPNARADEFVDFIRKRLPEKTVKHCLSVAKFMSDHADEAGITSEQAITAGLLHDSCKAMKEKELVAALETYQIDVSDTQREQPSLLHGPVGAAYCREALGIEDEAVCDAIFWHTTGRPNWSNVGLALYLADYSEPLRSHEKSEQARDRLRTKGYVAAVRFVAKNKYAYVAKKYTVDPMTQAFHDWVLNVWAGP